jgi:hypothetical protein
MDGDDRPETDFRIGAEQNPFMSHLDKMLEDLHQRNSLEL